MKEIHRCFSPKDSASLSRVEKKWGGEKKTCSFHLLELLTARNHHSQTRAFHVFFLFLLPLPFLFVSAFDELIGVGADWLLFWEGDNFSVTPWLIIARKYVTVPTPSEVCDRRLFDVHSCSQTVSQTVRQTAAQQTQDAQLPLTVLPQVPVHCKLSKWRRWGDENKRKKKRKQQRKVL